MAECFSYEVLKDGEERVLRIDCDQCAFVPSIEDNETVMLKTVDILVEVGAVSRIIFYQKRDYEYDFDQVKILVELAKFYKDIIEQKLLAYGENGATADCERYFPNRYAEMQKYLRDLRADPIAAYFNLKQIYRQERIKLEGTIDSKGIECLKQYLSLLNYLITKMEELRIIILTKGYFAEWKPTERNLYARIFRPTVKPDFLFAKLMSTYPAEGEELDAYALEGTDVTIFGFKDSVKTLYHIVPPEFKLDEAEYDILDSARRIMAEHKPTKQEFVDPERMREVFYNVGRDLIEELIEHHGYKIRKKNIDELAEILVRYTVGFGLVEVLLQDPKIQDISINSPMGQTTIFIVHQDFGDCFTNIIPTDQEAESWASKLRLLSGRPLDEANSILDTELVLPNARARVSAITSPLNPQGLAFSFRRHRDKPWTLPLFMKAGMIDEIGAGLLSFLIDGTRTLLIAGTRSSGKSSLLGSLLVEIMQRYRIITVEDTLELPTDALRKLGYNIQPMKVGSALTKGTTEMSASDGIRATLRLGDSALIIGEVRSSEAVALYEAMRVGAAANVVAGTIHGDSPYGVFDRVVNDIGVPKTSFKATDIIIVANPIRSPDGLHRWRRITQITEVRKTWEEDPLTESGFVDLMKYNPITDKLEPTDALLNGDSEILKSIASNIKEFAGNWEAIWNNILLRARMKKALVDAAVKTKDDDMLEAQFIIRANDALHLAIDKVKEDEGVIDDEKVFFLFNTWLEREIKKRQRK
ncbi:MAG: ATPase, T2SS/T4P/T4SS family [Candidatus Woesearchaeota archaeon]